LCDDFQEDFGREVREEIALSFGFEVGWTGVWGRLGRHCLWLPPWWAENQ